jgi:hypothetical protein
MLKLTLKPRGSGRTAVLLYDEELGRGGLPSGAPADRARP